MSTIFWLLISISSLHGPFISLGTPLKGRPRLPWLISSQPHRSQAFPTQCSLCSHKDPRNPAACPQLIFPVATLLTQPPTGNGCKCRTRNRLLCICTLPCFGPQWNSKSVNHSGGLKPLPTVSIKRFSSSSYPSDQTTQTRPSKPCFTLSFPICLPRPDASFLFFLKHFTNIRSWKRIILIC